MAKRATLAVAIPTMDRWESFLKEQINIYLDHPLIDCVIVCDENGNDIDDICSAGFDMNPKLRLYQNEQVLGVYGNKRQCILKAPTDFVAVLDSDNYFSPEYFFSLHKCIERDGPKAQMMVYSAGRNERLFTETGFTENKTAHFNGMQVTRANWNKTLTMPGWNFLLNDGNAVWPKDIIKHFPDLPEEEIVGTDSIFFARQAVQAGYSICIEPTLHYIHTVHSGSHWLQNATVSSRLMSTRDWTV
jgi:glycosyltransferase involved in cell wall biosynthesis